MASVFGLRRTKSRPTLSANSMKIEPRRNWYRVLTRQPTKGRREVALRRRPILPGATTHVPARPTEGVGCGGIRPDAKPKRSAT
jgi:hypothetical protein